MRPRTRAHGCVSMCNERAGHVAAAHRRRFMLCARQCVRAGTASGDLGALRASKPVARPAGAARPNAAAHASPLSAARRPASAARCSRPRRAETRSGRLWREPTALPLHIARRTVSWIMVCVRRPRAPEASCTHSDVQSWQRPVCVMLAPSSRTTLYSWVTCSCPS